MALADCGVSFYVPQKAGRPGLGFFIVCTCVIALVVYLGPAILPMVPTGIWVFALARIDDSPPHIAQVLVAMDHVSVGARSVAFADVRSVRSRGSRIIVRATRHALAFDASSLDPIERVLVVRHIQARVLFAQSGRRCTRSERSALEAFHVFGASAVRIHKRSVLEILDGEGPWGPFGKGRVFVRRSPSAVTAYRSNARTNEIEVGSLEMNLPGR